MSDTTKDSVEASAGGYEVDESASRVVVHTKATGLLARFAHDLEIAAPRIDVELDTDGNRWSATMRFSVAALRVVGVLRKGTVDESVLSPSDVDEIRRRLDDQVFKRTDNIVVRAEGATRERGTATVELPSGRQQVYLRHRVEERAGGEVDVNGEVTLSLEKLGVKEIKGPLGAFKVHDDIEVIYSVVVRRRGEG